MFGGRQTRLRKSNKLMLRIDNQENNDIDAIEIFKPSNSKACSPVKLYGEIENMNKEKEKDGKEKIWAILLSIILIIGIIGLIALMLFLFKEFRS